MRIRFLHTAQYELDEAYNYYEKQQEGLGPVLLDDIFDAIHRIKVQPEA